MEGNLFELAKTVDLKEYLETKYGLKLTRNMTRCPFHNDTNPSFSFYPKNQTVKCFADCGWNDGKSTGDIIHFVSKAEQIGRLEAEVSICRMSDSE